MLQQFVSDVEASSIPLMVIVPGIVIYELDGCVKIDMLFHLSNESRVVKRIAMV
jgi:hypothetical protein